MFLKSFVLRLEIKISVHECLVRVVNSFQISVLATFIDLETVEFSLKSLQRGSQLVGSIVLMAVLREFHLLIFDQGSIYFFQIVNIHIKTMNVTLQSRDFCLGIVNSYLTFITVLSSNVQLLVHCACSINQSVSFLL